MILNTRYMLWMLGAGIGAVVVYCAPASDVDVVEPGPRVKNQGGADAVAGSQSSRVTEPQWHLLTIRSRQVSDELALVFSDSLGAIESKGKAKPPLPVAPQIESPAQAPPLPFKFIGRYVEDGQTKFFLQNREQDIVVKVGDTIEQTYKVEAMSASALTFTFIPLNEKQTLDIGNTP